MEQIFQVYGLLKTIQVRRTRHAGHCWRSRDELISDVLLWTPTHGRAKAGRQARTYIQQLCEDTGCRPEDLPGAMNVRVKWRERVKDIRATSTTWWWWWWYGLLKETATVIIMPYKNTKAKVRSPDKDTDFFDIIAGVLQKDTLTRYLFIICLRYVLRTSIYHIYPTPPLGQDMTQGQFLSKV